MMFSIGILSFVFLIDPYCVSKLKCSRILQGAQTSVLVVNGLFKWEKTRLPILILGAHLGHLWSFYSLLTGRFAIQNYSLKSITNDLIGYHSRFFYYFLFSIKDGHARVRIWQFLYAPVSLYTPQTSREKLAWKTR